MNPEKNNNQHILIVDDMPKNIQVIGTLLREKGFMISIAGNGHQALEIVENSLPDIILLDIIMPGMDGFETCSRLKENPATKDIPVIFLSGLTETVDKVKGFQVGAVDFLTKPAEPEEVLARIKTHLTIRSLYKKLENLNAKLEEKVLLRTRELAEKNEALQKNEKELIFANAVLAAQQDASADGILVADEKGQMISFNQRFLDMWNIPEDVAEFRSDELVIQSILGRVVNPKAFLDRIRYLYDHPDEKSWDEIDLLGGITYERYSAPMSGPEGRYYGRVWYFRDITERKQAEEALKEANEIISRSPAVVFLWKNTKEWPVEFVTDNVSDIFGYSVRDFLSGKVMYRDIIYPDDLRRVAQELADFSQKQGREDLSRKPYRIISKNKTVKWLDDRTRIRRDAKGEITHYQGIVIDITESKRAEERLRQAQKMEAIGTLAGGIAHDFNNILSAMLGYTEMAIADLPGDSNVAKYLRGALKAENRAADLVRQILTFSRQSDQDMKPLRIQMVIKEALKLLRSSIPATIEIRQNIDPDCGPVLADPTQVHQIIMNLCTNAYHAMRETGGELGVSLEPAELTPQDLNSKINLVPGAYVKLDVSDTGCGISEKNLEKIFEPYFTTKTKGEGTGLGLALVHGIVLDFGGDITVYSEPGKGTVFHVYLPVIRETKQVIHNKETAPLPTGNERILFVDDDEEVVRMSRDMLESLGYEVTALTSSTDTSERFHQEPDDFDLVITDMTMPKMTGAELSRKILAIRPDIPIILCTGFSELIDANKAKEIGIQDFVMKPVLRKDLAKAVRKVLDA